MTSIDGSDTDSILMSIGSRRYDLSALVICNDCRRLRGRIAASAESGEVALDQECRCDPERPKRPRWDRFDFNEVVTLCHCCGAVLLPSGSRFSVWFCDSCKSRLLQFNRFFNEYLIPVGRHSFMAGPSGTYEPSEFLRSDDLVAEVTAFAESLKPLFDRIALVSDHLSFSVETALREAEFPIPGEIGLREYLTIVTDRRSESGKDSAMRLLIDAFEVPRSILRDQPFPWV